MADPKPLKLADLEAAVAGGAAAIRSITRLLPAGGPADKVFPPTYTKDGKAETKYALEMRRVDGAGVQTVLLDSVASQANRMEEALLEGYRAGKLRFPMVEVDFTKEEGLADLGTISSLQAPHRIADALLRDSLLGDKPFRHTDVGRAFTEARVANATAMYRYCPTALVFGIWDSTGPKGGLGAKFQRAMVSEIVGFNAIHGVKTASRLDPAGIQSKTPIYQSAADEADWTLDEKAAKKDKKGAIAFTRGAGEGKAGVASSINHGNIPPSLDATAGGVTLDYAVQTTVLSLPALRRLRFPEAGGQAGADVAARTSLAALALAALAYQRAQGYDLRSRSLLIPDGPLVLEVIGVDGGTPVRFSLDTATADALLSEAQAKATELGLPWQDKPVVLKPAPKLADLIRRSRETVMAGEGDDEGAS